LVEVFGNPTTAGSDRMRVGNRTGSAEANRARRARAGRLVAVVLAGTVMAGIAPATPALAHSRLEHTDPADGATVTGQRAEVTLTFNERVHGDFTTVIVRGPGGVSYSDGHVSVVDDVVHQPVYPLRSGAYLVAWRAISADGHPVEGQFRFTVALPPGQEPSAGPPVSTRPVGVTATSSDGDGWRWTVLALAVVAAAFGGLVWSRRRNRATP
jgi:copper resistance protein C